MKSLFCSLILASFLSAQTAPEAAPATPPAPVAKSPAPAGKPKRAPKPGVPAVQKPMTTLAPDQVFAVEGVPDWLAASDDAMWVSNKPKDSITKMNAKTNKVEATIIVGPRPCSGLAVGFGSVWAPLCGDKATSKPGGLARVDMKTAKLIETLPYPPANSEGGLATTKDSVWMLTGDNGDTLVRIDPDTNKAVAMIPVPEGSYSVAFGENALWVTSTKKNLVSRVDPWKNLITHTIEVDEEPRFLAVGEGYVWTLNQKKGTVSKIDPKLNKVVATIECGIPGGGGEITTGDGSVWATAFQLPVTRIDAETNKVTHQYIGAGGDAIKFGHKSVWLSNLREQNVWRLNPGKVGGKDTEE